MREARGQPLLPMPIRLVLRPWYVPASPPSHLHSSTVLRADCQKADWAQHKQACHSLQGSTWRTIAIHPGPRGAPSSGERFTAIATFSRHTETRASGAMDDLMSRVTHIDHEAGAPPAPPNGCGDRPFLVKLQLEVPGAPPQSMMVYDRKRSLGLVYVHRRDDDALFTRLVEEMRGPRGGYGGLKMYRWARRSGEWELSVCVDRQPTSGTEW